jgi:hypothetical protein
VANSEERLRSVLATLEVCRSALIESGSDETALLVSMAILELRMKVHQIADSELKDLCDALLRDSPRSPKPPQAYQRPFLKLVK